MVRRPSPAGVGRGDDDPTCARPAASGGSREPGHAPARRGRTPARRVRRPVAVPAHRGPARGRGRNWPPSCRAITRCSDCCRGRSARARPSWPCARCFRSSTPEGRQRLLAPTEVLAAQHAGRVETMLGPLGRAGQLDGADRATRIGLLTASLPAARRKTALLDAASGAAGIVIGHPCAHPGGGRASPTSVSWSSTSNTASESSSETPYAARRRGHRTCSS